MEISAHRSASTISFCFSKLGATVQTRVIRIHVKKTAVHVAKAALTMSATAAGLAMTTRRAVQKIPAMHGDAPASTSAIAVGAIPAIAVGAIPAYAGATVRMMTAGSETRVIRCARGTTRVLRCAASRSARITQTASDD